MDDLDSYRQLVRDIITGHTKVPYAYGDIQFETIFDSESDRYILMLVGWENGRRVHGCLIHVDIINGKLWIQRDGTEQGVGNQFVEAGVPKDRIVLGFRSEGFRQYTDFAVA